MATQVGSLLHNVVTDSQAGAGAGDPAEGNLGDLEAPLLLINCLAPVPPERKKSLPDVTLNYEILCHVGLSHPSPLTAPDPDTNKVLLLREYLSLHMKPFLQDPHLIRRVATFGGIFNLCHVIAQNYLSSLPSSLTNPRREKSPSRSLGPRAHPLFLFKEELYSFIAKLELFEKVASNLNAYESFSRSENYSVWIKPPCMDYILVSEIWIWTDRGKHTQHLNVNRMIPKNLLIKK